MAAATNIAPPASALGLQCRTLKVAGVELEIAEQGEGAPLLLLHGLDGIEGCSELIALLAKRFRVYAPSHPGFGASELPANFGCVDDIAYLYLDLIEQLDLRDVTIVGLSFGGWVAAEMLVKSCDRVSSAILAAPLGLRTADRKSKGMTDLFVLSDADADASLGIRRAGPLADLPPEELARIVRNREAVAVYGWSPYLSDPKLAQRLHRISVRSLILWGEGDRLIPSGIGRSFADAMPDAALELFDGGHRLYADQPAMLADRISAFAGVRVQEEIQ